MKQMTVLFFSLIVLQAFAPQSFAQTPATKSAAPPPTQAPPTIRPGDPLTANAFVELAKAINPAVVNIFTTSMPRGGMGGGRYNDPFFDMLERFYGFQIPEARPQQALGTGFVIRDDGLIITNNHVISGADTISVQFADHKKTYDATVVGSDQRTDLALIKITAEHKFPTLKMGSSKDLEVGEWVAAFGNPFGQGHTMTKGIISAKGRDISEINKFPLLQTDTPINPGNSGGPLVNLRAEVIGVNSAIDARAQGIGFAIPIDEVKTIIPQLEKFGRIKKAYLGVGLADLDPTAAMQLGLKDTQGALIAGVEPKGPADRAGIKPYDVIVNFNGKAIEDSGDLIDAVADSPIGEKAKVELIREGKKRSLEVTMQESREGRKARVPLARKKVTGVEAPLGLGFRVTEPTAELRKDFQIADAYSDRLVIVEVTPNTPASSAGLRPGDAILDVNKREVGATADLAKFLKKGTNTIRIARGDRIAILVLTTR